MSRQKHGTEEERRGRPHGGKGEGQHVHRIGGGRGRKKNPGAGAWGQDCLSEQGAEPRNARSSLEVVHGGSGDGSRNSALGPEI